MAKFISTTSGWPYLKQIDRQWIDRAQKAVTELAEEENENVAIFFDLFLT